jgi:hypothetical protein
VSALNFFLMYFKFFKYLSRVPRMEVILSTLTLAAVDLALFSVTAVIIMFGFSAAFYVCFGMEVGSLEDLNLVVWECDMQVLHKRLSF